MFSVIVDFIKNNPMISGAIFAMAGGTISYVFRTIPIGVKNAILRLFTVETVINSDSPLFNDMILLLKKKGLGNRTNRISSSLNDTGLRLISGSMPSEKTPGSVDEVSVFPFGEGSWFFDKFFYRISLIEKERNISWGIVYSMKITTLGWTKKKITKLLNEAVLLKKAINEKIIYNSSSQNGMWSQSFDNQEKKQIDSLFIDPNIKKRVIDRIDFFSSNKDFYTKIGIPWKLNLLLHGPPGTGKTTLVKAVSKKYNLSIYKLSLSEELSDENFITLFLNLPKTGNFILLIEDIDRFLPSETTGKQTKWALSTLLNCLDGTSAIEGGIIIMTTNHIEELDEALLRKGRVDLSICMDYISSIEAQKMAETFFKNVPKQIIEVLKETNEQKSGAYWQDLFLEHLDKEMQKGI